MAYFPFELATETPPTVSRLMRKGIEPLLSDVHVLLRLPLPELLLGVGANFTIAHVLLGVVAGVSASFFTRGLGDGKAFTGLLERFYPWDLEPGGGGNYKEKSQILWTNFRNPFAHSLGLAMEKKPSQPRVLRPRAFLIKIGRDRAPMMENEIEQAERSVDRPNFNPTLVMEPQKQVLWVEPFYWGVRKMVYRLSGDKALMQQVETDLKADLRKARLSI